MNWAIILGVMMLFTAAAPANPVVWPVNEVESAVPAYELPELLRTGEGARVESAEQWRQQRRPELVRMFEAEMYGMAPPRPALQFEVLEEATPALDGKALRKQVRIFFTGKQSGLAMDVLMYVPAGTTARIPFFWGLNFMGNHTTAADPGIRMPLPPAAGNGKARAKPLKEFQRGEQAERWQIEWLIAQGYGTATAWYEEVDPDYDDGFQNGVHALYPDIEAKRDAQTWGSLAAWAWALRVGMDYLEVEPWCDAQKVALHGHSRLGKATLWAGALDERFSVVISNNSGCGGAALSKRWFGETVGRINSAFPHWFCRSFQQWNGRESAMPYDQHQLLALVAPRGLLVGSAEGDGWADPEGEYLATQKASPAFVLFGERGLPAEFARKNLAISPGNPAYWQRPGKHDVTLEDWQRWAQFTKTRWGK